MKVKICGVRDLDNALICQQFNADFIGMNFVPGVNRKIDILTAINISSEIKNIKKVGIFADQSINEVLGIIKKCNLDYVQLSGSETINYCAKIQLPIIKTIKINCDSTPNWIHDHIFPQLENLLQKGITPLIESSLPGFFGGTGVQLPPGTAKEVANNFDIILAGGLNPSNVKNMINHIQPWGVDVASGVEINGYQDKYKIIEFISNAKSGDNE
tara:strand:- start:2126 stop:2767 length:642 start_codon:yes stop_codon:yes gene_type:complete